MCFIFRVQIKSFNDCAKIDYERVENKPLDDRKVKSSFKLSAGFFFLVLFPQFRRRSRRILTFPLYNTDNM